MIPQSLDKRRLRSAPKGRGALARVLARLWLLLYVGIVAGAPVADGFIEHGDQTVLHVEDAEGGNCPTSHGAESCDICQLAQSLRAIAGSVTLEIPRASDAGAQAPGARDIAAVALHFLDGRSSRAPPLG